MPEIPKILIPGDLLPTDGRFGSGPSRIRGAFVDDVAATGTSYLGTSHRKSGVRSVVSAIQAGLATMYSLPDSYEILLGVGGATAFWDAAAFGLIRNRSAHFVCGEFSQKFAASARTAPHLDEPVVISADYGSAPQPEVVAGVDTVAYIHNETSTGVMAPFARMDDALVTVDGTSGAGAIAYDATAVDAYYFSPQKALGSEGGLWLSIMSPMAIERIESIDATDRSIPPFLSLKTALDNSRKAQTYNTPALITLYLIARQIEFVNENGGIDWADSNVRRSSRYLYEWASASAFAEPFVEERSLRSPTVVTLDLDPNVPASHVAGVLRDNGIVDTESYRKLGRNQLRIATFPNVTFGDVKALAASIDYVVQEL
ncbi:MAG: phosphoserine transaminase [Actinomycetota bacterium]